MKQAPNRHRSQLEVGKKRRSDIVAMDLLGDGATEDEVVDLEVMVPVGWERRLGLLVS
jgi:hypothetical protein